jgi:hypothetical protein
MMEAVRTSEASVDNQFARQYNPEDSSEQQSYLFRRGDYRNKSNNPQETVFGPNSDECVGFRDTFPHYIE